jgi:hypothetical protein
MSSTPVPAVLQACHEARNQGLYQQAFNISSVVERRYVWVNFEIDMISIGADTWFDTFEPAERLLFRRLTFERENGESFFHFQSHKLREFSNLEEIHVICVDGLMAWQDAWEYVYWPCPKENLRFIDKETGQIAVAKIWIGWWMNGWRLCLIILNDYSRACFIICRTCRMPRPNI